ncbi:Nramp family divalent metal transporter [Planctomicrobium sp. SH661]|uniref:Nramp family divalent metal transporter n=1 Tax=Planctomicrobium sp. SH661 TaxID=3448124 RepID=UPI003F5BCD58
MANRIPPWNTADLPEPQPLQWKNWASFIGPGIVMMGIQIGGGEWLFGPEITARYGGGLMWVATVAIVLQVFYNMECGRYAMYCGEPVLTGFMRKFPGPGFWMGFVFLLNINMLIPGLSTHGAAIIASLWLDRPPTEADRFLVTGLAYACLIGVVLPVLVGGKIYNMLQAIMTAKVLFVLGFCLTVGVLFVPATDWWNIFSGFVKFGNLPVTSETGKETLVNALFHYREFGEWPAVELANIAVLGAFAGYAGGGGLANSTYSNFVRDKGWGMGKQVGAIASAVGGKSVTLSHTGSIFPLTSDNLRKWSGWWRYILTDQVFIWAPGCFMGMALPALMSIHFAPFSTLQESGISWAQAIVTADGMRLAPGLSAVTTKILWLAALWAGLAVMLPSQMSIVDDFSRRWTDAIWTGSRHVRENFKTDQVKWIYYSILAGYVLWSLVCAYLFSVYGTPKLMVVVIANLNNLALGITALQLLWINLTFLPKEIRPRWYQILGVLACSVFYLGLSALVFFEKQWPELVKLFQSTGG